MHSLLSGTGVRPAPHWEHTAEPGLMETVKPGQTEHVPPITSLYWPGKARVGGGEQAGLWITLRERAGRLPGAQGLPAGSRTSAAPLASAACAPGGQGASGPVAGHSMPGPHGEQHSAAHTVAPEGLGSTVVPAGQAAVLVVCTAAPMQAVALGADTSRVEAVPARSMARLAPPCRTTVLLSPSMPDRSSGRDSMRVRVRKALRGRVATQLGCGVGRAASGAGPCRPSTLPPDRGLPARPLAPPHQPPPAPTRAWS